MLVNYHTHTQWSDGQNTLAEMIDGARLAGLDELGISDHYAPFPDGRRVDWGISDLDTLDAYITEVQAAMRDTTDLKIRLGIEVDFFPETVETVRDVLNQYPFDYVIGSVHFVENLFEVGNGRRYFPIDFSPDPWEAITQDARNIVWQRYWQLLRVMAETGLFDFVGHLDLPKKYGYLPTVDTTAEATAALEAIAAAGMAIEINTAGWNKPIGEAYPSLELLTEAFRLDIPLTINADAHTPGDLTANYDRACALARQAGYTEILRFAGRQRFAFPLP
ncbi:MAG: histidinol-phosphatase HisJ family protein [Armatimonadota bacterium]